MKTYLHDVMKTYLHDVQIVVGRRGFLYANKAILDKIKPRRCEPLVVYGSQKKVCVKNTKLQVLKGAQTLEEIRTILHADYPPLAPLTL